MGLGGISIWQLLIVLLIVVMLFGTKRLRSLGGDLGSALKGFKKAVSEEDEKKSEQEQLAQSKSSADVTAASSEQKPVDKAPDSKA